MCRKQRNNLKRIILDENTCAINSTQDSKGLRNLEYFQKDRLQRYLSHKHYIEKKG